MSHLVKIIFSIYCLLFLNSAIFSQKNNTVDSLEQELKSSLNKAEAYNELAKYYQLVSPKDAMIYSKMAKEEANRKKDKKNLGEAFLNYARLHQLTNQYELSNLYIDSAEALFKETENISGIITCEVINATSLMLQGNYEEALKIYQINLEEAEKIHAKDLSSLILMNIGRIYRVYGQSSIAQSYFKRSLSLALEINNQQLIGSGYFFIGLIFQDDRQIEQAIDNYLKTLKIYEKQNYNTKLPYLLTTLGSLYIDTENFSEALKYFNKAQSYYLYSADKWGMNELYINKGIAYIGVNNRDSAWYFFNRSLEISREINEKSGECRALNFLGEILIFRKEFEKALEYLNKSLEINTGLKNDYILVNTLLYKGRCYVHSGRIQKGIDLIQKSLKIADSLNFRPDKMVIYKDLSEAYSKMKDYRKALIHHEKYAELNDSLFREKAHYHFTALEKKYESEKKEKEINQLKISNIESEMLVRKQRSIRNIFILGFFFSILVVFLFYRGNKLKKKAIAEKEILLKEIHHRVKNNLQIISSLLSIQTEYNTDKKVLDAMKESQSRIKAMALIHQFLYQEENLIRINIEDYLKQLISILSSLFQKPGTTIQTNIKTDKHEFDIETSIPLGLIVTELVSNAFKYAFSSDSKGVINIKLTQLVSNKYLLEVSDNGRGLPADKDISQFKTLGLQLVRILTDQLDGQFNYIYNKGAIFNVEFTESL